MTVPSTPRRAGPYSGTGVLVGYPFSFKTFDKGDLSIVTADSTGVESMLVVDSTALVTLNPDQNTNPGGVVYFAAAGVATALPSGYTLVILGALGYEQRADLPEGGSYRAESVENAMDALAIQVQQLDERLTRALLFSATDAFVSPLPDASVRAGTLLGFDEIGRTAVYAPADQSASALALLLGSTASASASGILSFLQSGASAAAISLDAKLKQFVSRSEFPSDATFNAAKGTRPSIDGSSNLDAKVTPAAEPTQGNLSDMLRPVAAGPRDAIVYNSATSVKVFRTNAVMGGFRYRGQYTKGRAPCFPMPTSKVASVSTGLGAEAAVRTENWYAVFACANAGDATATIKVMPYLRAGTVAGSNVPLIKAGEGIHALTAQTYAWTATNNLAGTDCLVISEGGAFSGRVTTITANVAGQVTLGTIGSVAAYDFLLPAPPGFTHYVYLGSFYFDTGEVRNIYDTGTLAKSRMIYVQEPSAALAGAVVGPPGAEFNCAGYICPLATAVVFDSSCVLSTASTGSFGESFDPDGGGHVVQQGLRTKAVLTNESVVIDNVQVPFLYHQKFWYSNAGALNATRISGQFNVTGWIEP